MFPFAIIYGLISILRNGFYNLGFFKSSKFSLPIINIGNLSVGGTGKTPHTEHLIRLLKNDYQLFTLSRGFGRKERGFIIADDNSDAKQIGDEPLQYQKKYGNEIGVAVDANRVNGVLEICRHQPETNLVLLDDAFQHRAIHAGLNILITAYNSPFYNDYLLPMGDLRERRVGAGRADIIIVSKCPDFDSIDKDAIINRIKPKANQTVFFSKINYGSCFHFSNGLNKSPEKVAEISGKSIVLVTGIAQSEPLVAHLSKNNKIIKHFRFQDHYNFKEQDIHEIHNIIDKFVPDNPVIITTEKDAMRLMNDSFMPLLEKYNWIYQSIEIELDRPDKFNEIIKRYVEENSRND